jgi:hypothetical protein
VSSGVTNRPKKKNKRDGYRRAFEKIIFTKKKKHLCFLDRKQVFLTTKVKTSGNPRADFFQSIPAGAVGIFHGYRCSFPVGNGKPSESLEVVAWESHDGTK